MNSMHIVALVLVASSCVSAQFGFPAFGAGAGTDIFQDIFSGLNFGNQQQTVQQAQINQGNQNQEALDAASNQQLGVNSQAGIQAGSNLLRQEGADIGTQQSGQAINQVDGAASQSERSSTKLAFEDQHEFVEDGALSVNTATEVSDKNKFQQFEQVAGDDFLNFFKQGQVQGADQNLLNFGAASQGFLNVGENVNDASQINLQAEDRSVFRFGENFFSGINGKK